MSPAPSSSTPPFRTYVTACSAYGTHVAWRIRSPENEPSTENILSDEPSTVQPVKMYPSITGSGRSNSSPVSYPDGAPAGSPPPPVS